MYLTGLLWVYNLLLQCPILMDVIHLKGFLTESILQKTPPSLGILLYHFLFLLHVNLFVLVVCSWT